MCISLSVKYQNGSEYSIAFFFEMMDKQVRQSGPLLSYLTKKTSCERKTGPQ